MPPGDCKLRGVRDHTCRHTRHAQNLAQCLLHSKCSFIINEWMLFANCRGLAERCAPGVSKNTYFFKTAKHFPPNEIVQASWSKPARSFGSTGGWWGKLARPAFSLLLPTGSLTDLTDHILGDCSKVPCSLQVSEGSPYQGDPFFVGWETDDPASCPRTLHQPRSVLC